MADLKCIPGVTNPVDGHAFLSSVDDIACVLKLAENAVAGEAGRNEELEAAWGAIRMARGAVARLRDELEGVSSVRSEATEGAQS